MYSATPDRGCFVTPVHVEWMSTSCPVGPYTGGPWPPDPLTDVLSCPQQAFSLQLLEKDLCNTTLIQLLVRTLCEPLSIGFHVGDVQVMDHLPSVCVNLMKALRQSHFRDLLEMHLKEEMKARRWACHRAQPHVVQLIPGSRTLQDSWQLCVWLLKFMGGCSSAIWKSCH